VAARPLDGITILALEQMQALPYATQLLARLGADVIKVEPPGGESGRASFPAIADPEGRSVGITFLRNNLGKRSITVDLKQPAGRDLVLRLAATADVVAQNFKAGAVDRLGLGWDAVHAVNPRAVYLSVTGFGTGPTPYAGWPAYAPIAEAMSGLYEWKREPDAPPVVSPVGALGDTGTGLFAVIGVLAALQQRNVTGEGQHIDVAMYDAMVALNDAGISYWSMGVTEGGRAPLVNHAFRARDGWYVLQCGRRHMFEALARLVGHEEWLDDDRLLDGRGWLAHLDDLIRPGIETWSAGLDRTAACAALSAVGIAAGPVQTPRDVIVDPHVTARRMVVPVDGEGEAAAVLAVGNPVKLSSVPEVADRRCPWLNEHTDEVLAELGLTAAEVDALKDAGVVA
jgi:crotonobetainyl-CoA:carnitine CoA-transferase CaiB-like acyl-CoA transferase